MKKKILVIDDDAEIVNHLVKKLNESNYWAIPCYDSYNAIHLAHKELPDLIITDYNLPCGSGLSMYKGIKSSAKTESIPVMFISAYPFDKVKHDAMEMGAVDFITKPFDMDKVLEKVGTVLGGQK